MRVEHIGIGVPAPIDMGNWYSKYLGFEIVMQDGTNDDGVAFIVDDAGQTVLELYKLPDVKPLDPRILEPTVLHIAIDVEDPYQTAMELVEHGAEFVGESPRNSYKGEKYFVRDPWGFVLQLVNRKHKLHVHQ